jgi:inosose dehydratase
MGILGKNQTRREALAGMAALAGGTLLGEGLLPKTTLSSPAGYSPILSVQIYVWMQHLQSQKKTLEAGVEEALAAIRRAGYRRVELTSDFFLPGLRARTLDSLKKHELEMPTIYAAAAMHEAKAAERSIADVLQLAEMVKAIGTQWILTNPSPKLKQERKSDDELNTQANYLNKLGAELQKHGMRLMVHHHTPELMENAREWRHQLAHTDHKLVSCCVDVEWAVRGGQEPLAFLREVGSRLVSLHVRNSQGGVWMEDFSDGDIDYTKVAAYLKQIDYAGYLIVELAYEKNTKITRPLEEDLRLSRLYAEKMFAL